MAWAVIIASIWLAVELQSVWVSVLAIFIVATRQNILGLLVHEQSHCLGFKASYGDSLVNFLVAYPLIVLTVEGYSQVHLSHHRYFMTEQDPDLLRKSGKGWTFPMKAGRLGKLFLTDLQD
jgi:fatty acid desaturase